MSIGTNHHRTVTASAQPDAISVLFVSPIEEDRAALNGILNWAERTGYTDSNWVLLSVTSLASAAPLLREKRIPIVLAECELGAHTWHDVLAETSSLIHSPLLIVTSHLADGRLWAEALNLGAYDVLSKPFHAEEVLRSLTLAWLRWASRQNDERIRESKSRAAAA